MIDPLNDRQPRFLQHIVGINSAMQARIHPEIHHAPQSISMAGEQSCQRILVSIHDSIDQVSFLVS